MKLCWRFVLLISLLSCQTDLSSQQDTMTSASSLDDPTLPSTDAFDKDTVTDAFQKNNHTITHNIEIWKDIPWINLNISKDHWDLLQEDVEADVEVNADLSMTHIHRLPIGIEIHGYSSRQFPKQNLKLKFDLAIDLGVFEHPLASKQLILKASWKDHSNIREALSWYALQQIGLNPPMIQWVHLMINQEDYGLYQVVEPMNLDYFARRGYDDRGSLYKAVNQSATFAPDKTLKRGFEQKKVLRRRNDQATSNWLLSDSENPLIRTYQEKVSTNQNMIPDEWIDLSYLQSAMQVMPETPTLEEIQVLLSTQLNLEMLLKRLAWMSYTQASDAVTQNFYLYNQGTLHNPYWIWANWDADMSFSAFWKVNVISQPWYQDHLLTGRSYWSKKLVNNEHIRRKIALLLREYLQDQWSATHMQRYADLLMQRLAIAIEHDLHLWNRKVSLDEVMPPIYAFIQQRPNYLLSLLDDFIITAQFDVHE